jgi:hypothetical protein
VATSASRAPSSASFRASPQGYAVAIVECRSTDGSLCPRVLHFVVALATFPDAEPLFPDAIYGLVRSADAAFM